MTIQLLTQPTSLSAYRVLSFFFFFFQAEDGIRDYKVTGVQTCALPIYRPRLAELRHRAARSAVAKLGESWPISRWLTTQPMSSWVNSIGSSIVMMWSLDRKSVV